jgi:hypothetical protein
VPAALWDKQNKRRPLRIEWQMLLVLASCCFKEKTLNVEHLLLPAASSLGCALLQTCIGCIVPSNNKLLHPFICSVWQLSLLYGIRLSGLVTKLQTRRYVLFWKS